jgi:hypothetical protein
MRWLFCAALLAGLAVPAAASGPGEGFLPVNPEELKMTEFKPVPGAAAVLLYYANQIDDVEHTEFFYSRIKVFTDGGKRQADVEIPMVAKTDIVDLQARTIHPDGTIVEFTDRPFEKTVFRVKGARVRVQAFTLPQVTAGSIIEYKYKLHYGDKGLRHHDWIVQHDLFTVKGHFRFRYDKHNAVRWLPTKGLEKSPDRDLKEGVFQMDVENVSAFEAEEQMPPEDSYKLEVKFFYTLPFMNSPASYWYETGQYWSRGMEYFLGDHGDGKESKEQKEIRAAAEEVVRGETDSEKKLRKLYARAQEVRNLSYERTRTQKEQKQEDLKPPKTIVDVLKHNYGTREDITRLFVALARGAGFTASVVFVSSRESRLFDREVLSFSQLDGEIAQVKLNGKSVFLDPGTRFCPYGLMRWMRTGTAAMDMRDPGQLINTPGAGHEAATIFRTADLKLSPEGSLKGEIRVEFGGAEALERRLSALDTDDAGRKKEMEDEVKEWLPVHAKVTMTDSAAWEKENEPLTVIFAIEVPEFASAAGKRLLVPFALFQPKRANLFKSGTRKYPVYFHYAFTERDEITLELPEGYSAETLASAQLATTPYASYKSQASMNGKRMQLERALLFNGVFFQPDRYADLREFFGKVQAGDESQSVLRQGPPAEAQKAN